MSYFILRNGQQYGPYSPADLERYLTVGGIVTIDLARTEEMNQWLPLSQIYGNTPPPPPAAEDLDTGCGSGDERQGTSGSSHRENSFKVQPMPPPDHVPVYPTPPESSGEDFSNRIRHILSRLQFGLSGSHKSGH